MIDGLDLLQVAATEWKEFVKTCPLMDSLKPLPACSDMPGEAAEGIPPCLDAQKVALAVIFLICPQHVVHLLVFHIVRIKIWLLQSPNFASWQHKIIRIANHVMHPDPQSATSSAQPDSRFPTGIPACLPACLPAFLT